MEEQVPAHVEKYLANFKEHMKFVDELALGVLKGHLLIEGALDNIIDMIFFYPDYVREARLSFNQKLQIARAYCLRKNNNSMWALLAGINAIRNEISHNLAGEKRQKKIDQLRTMFLAELQPAEAKRYERAADHIIAASACGMCIGFLGTYEHDLKGLRKFVDLLDIAINSDKEHVALKE